MPLFQIGIMPVHSLPVAVHIVELIGIVRQPFGQNLRLFHIGDQAAEHRAAAGKILLRLDIGFQRIDPVDHPVHFGDGGIILHQIKTAPLRHRSRRRPQNAQH